MDLSTIADIIEFLNSLYNLLTGTIHLLFEFVTWFIEYWSSVYGQNMALMSLPSIIFLIISVFIIIKVILEIF